MGIKTLLSLEEVNKLFNKNFKTLSPTDNGISDTTYIADDFVIKKYENKSKEKIEKIHRFQNYLHDKGLRVPKILDESGDWYLIEKLKGTHPKHTKLFHIRELARFLSAFHKLSQKKSIGFDFFQNRKVLNDLRKIRKYFYYHKKFEFLKDIKFKNDGIIHGDIFKDNTIFDKGKVSIFDFIDSGDGDFLFDIAVIFSSFKITRKKTYMQIFLNIYNQRRRVKYSIYAVKPYIKIALSYYELLKLVRYQNIYKS